METQEIFDKLAEISSDYDSWDDTQKHKPLSAAIGGLIDICRLQELRIQQLEKYINGVEGEGILPSKEQFMQYDRR